MDRNADALMTWGDFKAAAEAMGVLDESPIEWIRMVAPRRKPFSVCWPGEPKAVGIDNEPI